MERINASVSWSGNNYCAGAQGENINGIVSVTNKTLEGVKKAFESAFKFHIEGCIKDGDEIADFLKTGEYELQFALETSALLHSLDGILTRSAIAKASGVNERQIGHYASGHRNPRPAQKEKIIKGIHSIGKELASVK